MEKPRILWVITGPTAVGKTDYAIQLAQEINSPIISADSRQIYNEINIGVAKPDAEQLNKVQHYFINHLSIHDDYSAGKYAAEARHLINVLFEKHDQLIVCGGTGLYINALLNGLDDLPKRNAKLREELETILKTEGIEILQKQLKTLNPEKFEKMDYHNPQRLVRAIEIERSEKIPSSEIPDFKHAFEIKNVLMDLPRLELYKRINQRVDQMIEAGLEEEARQFINLQHLNALQTVGYSEWWPYFRGEVSLPEVIDKIKQHTRNYAKRQMTWFRNKGLKEGNQ